MIPETELIRVEVDASKQEKKEPPSALNVKALPPTKSFYRRKTTKKTAYARIGLLCLLSNVLFACFLFGPPWFDEGDVPSEQLPWVCTFIFLANVTVFWALTDAEVPGTLNITSRATGGTYCLLIAAFAVGTFLTTKAADDEKKANLGAAMDSALFSQNDTCVWASEAPEVPDALVEACPYVKDYPVVPPSHVNISFGFELDFATLGSIIATYDGIKEYWQLMNAGSNKENGRSEFDPQACDELLRRIVCAALMPPCDAGCKPVKMCTSNCGAAASETCPVMDEAAYALAEHADIVKSVIGDEKTFEIIRYLALQMGNSTCGRPPVWVNETTSRCFKNADEKIETTSKVQKKCTLEGFRDEKARLDDKRARKKKRPDDRARRRIMVIWAALTAIAAAKSAIIVRACREARNSWTETLQTIRRRGIIAVVTLVGISLALVCLAMYVTTSQAMYLDAGRPLNCGSNPNATIADLEYFEIVRNVLWGCWWMLILAYLCVYRSLGRRWPWEWTAKRISSWSKSKVKNKSKGRKKKRLKPASLYWWYKRNFSFQYGKYFAEKQFALFVVGIVLQYNYFQEQVEQMDALNALLFSGALALNGAVSPMLLSSKNPLYSRDILLIFDGFIDTFYVAFNGIALVRDLNDRAKDTKGGKFCYYNTSQMLAIGWPILRIIRALSRVVVTLAKGKSKSQLDAGSPNRAPKRTSTPTAGKQGGNAVVRRMR